MDSEAQKLTALEEELRRDLDAITRVRRLMALKNGSLVHPPDERQLAFSTVTANVAQDEDEKDVDRSSLIGTIEETINANPSARWTTQKMLTHLNAEGYPLRAAKPVYSVGQALNKLFKQGRIRIVRKGAGSEPNIYRSRGIETEGKSHGNEVVGDLVKA